MNPDLLALLHNLANEPDLDAGSIYAAAQSHGFSDEEIYAHALAIVRDTDEAPPIRAKLGHVVTLTKPAAVAPPVVTVPAATTAGALLRRVAAADPTQTGENLYYTFFPSSSGLDPKPGYTAAELYAAATDAILDPTLPASQRDLIGRFRQMMIDASTAAEPPPTPPPPDVPVYVDPPIDFDPLLPPICPQVEGRDATDAEIAAHGYDPVVWGGSFGSHCDSGKFTPWRRAAIVEPEQQKSALPVLLGVLAAAWLLTR